MDRFTAKNGATYAFREQPGCSGCAFDADGECTHTHDDTQCSPVFRADQRSGIWVRIGMEPVATDLAPRESLLAHIADLTARADLAEKTLARAGWEHIPDAIGGPVWKPANTTAAKLRAERDELAARLADQIDALCSELKAAHDVLLRKRAEAEALRRERDELKARERACPTIPEAEARALMRAVQAVAAHVGLGLEASPHQVVDAVGSMAARLAEIELAEPVRGAARLTDEQIVELRQTTRPLPGQWGDTKAFARAIEAAVLSAGPAAPDLAGLDGLRCERDAAQGAAPVQAAPADGCGACGDACKRRGSCRLADESPKPSGWKVVPVEPTPEMIDAADSVNWYNGDTQASVINMWHCMLAAATERAEPELCRCTETCGEEWAFSVVTCRKLQRDAACRCGPDGCSDSVACPRAGGAA